MATPPSHKNLVGNHFTHGFMGQRFVQPNSTVSANSSQQLQMQMQIQTQMHKEMSTQAHGYYCHGPFTLPNNGNCVANGVNSQPHPNSAKNYMSFHSSQMPHPNPIPVLGSSIHAPVQNPPTDRIPLPNAGIGQCQFPHFHTHMGPNSLQNTSPGPGANISMLPSPLGPGRSPHFYTHFHPNSMQMSQQEAAHLASNPLFQVGGSIPLHKNEQQLQQGQHNMQPSKLQTLESSSNEQDSTIKETHITNVVQQYQTGVCDRERPSRIGGGRWSSQNGRTRVGEFSPKWNIESSRFNTSELAGESAENGHPLAQFPLTRVFDNGSSRIPKESAGCTRSYASALICKICDRSFTNRFEMEQHFKCNVKCMEKDCSFEASRKIFKEHKFTHHEQRFVQSVVPPKSEESVEEIQQWIDERKINYPTEANVKQKVQQVQERRARGELIDDDAGKRRQRMREILAEQRELGLPVAEVPSHYINDGEYYVGGHCKRRSQQHDDSLVKPNVSANSSRMVPPLRDLTSARSVLNHANSLNIEEPAEGKAATSEQAGGRTKNGHPLAQFPPTRVFDNGSSRFSKESAGCRRSYASALICKSCDRSFTNRFQIKQHVKCHVKCVEKDCSFEASRNILKKHKLTHHEKQFVQSVVPPKSEESVEEIRHWIEERKKNYPTEANVKRKVQQVQERRARSELIDDDAGKRRERLREILAKQRELLGLPVAEVQSHYFNDGHYHEGHDGNFVKLNISANSARKVPRVRDLTSARSVLNHANSLNMEQPAEGKAATSEQAEGREKNRPPLAQFPPTRVFDNGSSRFSKELAGCTRSYASALICKSL